MEKGTTSGWISIVSIFLSGAFGLLTAWVTWVMATRREKRRFSLELNLKEWQDLELLYANSIAVIDKIAQVTKSGNDYSSVIDQMTMVSAQISIRGSEAVNKQYHIVSEGISVWTALYQNSKPEKIGEGRLAMITTEHIKNRDDADKVFAELVKDIRQYIELVKSELAVSKPSRF